MWVPRENNKAYRLKEITIYLTQQHATKNRPKRCITTHTMAIITQIIVSVSNQELTHTHIYTRHAWTRACDHTQTHTRTRKHMLPIQV